MYIPTLTHIDQGYRFESVLPPEVKFEDGQKETLVTEKLEDSKIIVEAGCKATLIAVLTEGTQPSTDPLLASKAADIQIEFGGRGAELVMLVFIVGREKDRFHFKTTSRHGVQGTKASYFVKGTMFEQSSADYHGNLIIEKGADETDVYLAHHTLLLGPAAKANTFPGLEIEADEVKAGHAATVGRVDEEVLFYLQARGFEKQEAEQLLVRGFFEDLLMKIANESLRDDLREKILARLP